MTLLTRHPAEIRRSLIEPHAGSQMRYFDFLDADLDHDHYEWVNGEVVEMAAVAEPHWELVAYLLRLLADYTDAKDLGRWFGDPFQMKLSKEGSGRQPDLFFVTRDRLDLVEQMYLRGPADLVIEVVSPGSRRVDRVDKFSEYEQAGVREYWIVDPTRRQAEFYVLQNGRFAPARVDDQGRFFSTVLTGLWMEADWFWQRPAKAEILKRLGV